MFINGFDGVMRTGWSKPALLAKVWAQGDLIQLNQQGQHACHDIHAIYLRVAQFGDAVWITAQQTLAPQVGNPFGQKAFAYAPPNLRFAIGFAVF